MRLDLYRIEPQLQRAKTLLENPEQHEIRYACLELRLCLEKIAYRQLKQYGQEIPGSVVKKWQPDQLLRILASFDPTSEQDGTLSIGLQSSPDAMPESWSKVGDVKSIKWKVFRGHYQRLGSFLHQSITDPEKVLDPSKLVEIIKDIEHVMSTQVITAFKNTINAKCDCGNKIFIGASEFENGELVKCSGQNCELYWVKETLEDGEQVLKPAKMIIYPCPCGAYMHVLPQDVWKRFSCGECESTYRVNLGYSKVIKL